MDRAQARRGPHDEAAGQYSRYSRHSRAVSRSIVRAVDWIGWSAWIEPNFNGIEPRWHGIGPLDVISYAHPPNKQERLADGEFLCCRPVYVGRNILLCGRKDGVFPFQCLVGPDWPCMVVTYAIITVPTVIFFVLVCVQPSWLGLGLELIACASRCTVLVGGDQMIQPDQ